MLVTHTLLPNGETSFQLGAPQKFKRGEGIQQRNPGIVRDKVGTSREDDLEHRRDSEHEDSNLPHIQGVAVTMSEKPVAWRVLFFNASFTFIAIGH